MSESRFAPLSGVVFAALLIASTAVIRNFSFVPPADEALEIFDDRWSILTGAYLGMLSTFFLLWFAGSLWEFLQKSPTSIGRLTSTSLGGAVAAAATMLIGFVILNAGAERLAVQDALDPVAATTILDISGTILGNAAPIAFAVMIGAAGLAIYRSGVLPSWVAWASGAFAIGLASPFNWLFITLVIVWVAAMSVTISIKNRDRVAAQERSSVTL